MSVWRCRVCEAVNQGGRTCVSCGTQVPLGEPMRAAVRTRLPTADPPAEPVPPTPRRRELREVPTLAELLFADPEDLYELAERSHDGRLHIEPIPGGCLMGPTMRPRRRRGWF